MARILVIDDDEPVRTTVRETLEHLGHTVIEARAVLSPARHGPGDPITC